MRTIIMISTAVTAILFILWLQQFGDWIVLFVSIFLIIAQIQAIDKSSRWKYWIACVLLVSYSLSFTGLRVRKTEEGRIQIVKILYPINPKIYIEGTEIDTLELATGYSTFAGWYYSVQRSKYYAIRDSNQMTTICYYPPYGRVIRGHQMRIEKYRGQHGEIDIFSYVDDKGKRVRRDYYGKNPDDADYKVNVLDNADYIPDYIP